MDLDEIRKNYDFSGRTIVISGGAGVLGGEMACALLGCGANVAILDHDARRKDQPLEQPGCHPGCSISVYADVLEKETLVQARQIILEKFGHIDGLINAAGGNREDATTGPDLSFFDLPQDAMQAVFNLNLMGTFLTCQVFGRAMLERPEAVILNVSSMNADRPLTRVPAYSAAKAAVNNFTAWLAVYMAQNYSSSIRVNAIAPGFFHTSQNHYLLYDEQSGKLSPRGESIIAHTPMRRFGEPQDLLGAVLWLMSPASRFVTGAVISIDGGFSAYSGV